MEYAAGLEDIEEYVRLLYVAVTRAQARLIIVDIEKEDPPVVTMTQGILSLRKGFSGLILRALESGPLFVRCHDATDYTKDEIQATKKYVNELPVLSFQPEIFTPLAKPDAVTPDDIMEVPIGGLGILMAKNSVDDMTYERVDESNVVTIMKKW